MLVIRPDQIDAIRVVRLQSWLTAYLERSYPEEARHWRSTNLSDFVRATIGDARGRRITDDEDLRKYVHVAFILGRDFPSRYDWARRLLENPDYHHPRARMRALEDDMLKVVAKATAQQS